MLQQQTRHGIARRGPFILPSVCHTHALPARLCPTRPPARSRQGEVQQSDSGRAYDSRRQQRKRRNGVRLTFACLLIRQGWMLQHPNGTLQQTPWPLLSLGYRHLSPSAAMRGPQVPTTAAALPLCLCFCFACQNATSVALTTH